MIVKFDNLPNMMPFCEDRSVFLMRICGKTLAEHVLQSLATRFSSHQLAVQICDSRLSLDNDAINLSTFVHFVQEQVTRDEPEIHANVFHLAETDTFVMEYPWDLLRLLSHVMNTQQAFISPKAIIEDGVDVRGNVHIEAGTRVCRGAILQGDVYIGSNCLIGFNSIVRGPCAIEDNCKIGAGVEIKNALIGPDTLIGPLCYVGDSVVGTGSSLGALTRTSNFRLDREPVSVFINNGWINTGTNKLGCFIGDDVQIGAGVITFPGTLIGNHTFVGPQMLVDCNLQSNKRYYVQQKVITIPNSFFEE
jgi:UDP-N-acetylglucosamine diphosphorylase / glucose-1-phosphate thymidylyltransferase / UDP-N-acetylgalactosamine diphosphorylase / glucosamine-1-phosphate N-acetyltransferase / galactosamine-1-phosphate N-acetyltransferase